MRILRLIVFCFALAGGTAYGQFQGGWDVPHGRIIGGGYYGGAAYGFGYYGGRGSSRGYGCRQYDRYGYRRGNYGLNARGRVLCRPFHALEVAPSW